MQPRIKTGFLCLYIFLISTSLYAANFPNDLDIKAPDKTVRPQDNFYSYINGNWLSTTPIPENRPWYGTYVIQYDNIQNHLRAIVDNANRPSKIKNTDDKNITNLYRSILDIKKRNSLNLKPLQDDFTQIDNVKTAKDFSILVADFNRQHYSMLPGDNMPSITPFIINFWPDEKDSRKWSAVLSPQGLGLPSNSYYLSTDSNYQSIREKYLIHVQRVLILAKIKNAENTAKEIIALETHLAQCQNNYNEAHNLEASYNPLSIEDLKKIAPAFDWKAYIKAAKLDALNTIIVSNPKYLECTNQLFTENIPLWRNYFKWQLLRRYSPYLNQEFTAVNFNFYEHILFGNSKPTELSKRAIEMIDYLLPDALDRQYVNNYLEAESKVRVQHMAEAIRDTYLQRIETLDWLSSEAKAEATKKLQQLIIKVGSPNHWPERPSLTVKANDVIGNLRRIAEANYLQKTSQLGKPVDRNVWFSSAHVNNAYYNPTTNDIVIPAGYIQPPLFDKRLPDAFNYGGLGTVIAHEMGHALDDRGSQYDADGRLRDWWSTEDHKYFLERTNHLIEQFNQYQPIKGKFVNGQQTLSENIADLTGLTLSYATIERLQIRMTPEDNEYFFTAWATRWRANIRDALTLRILTTDSHAPVQYRCIGPLKNFSVFYQYMDIKPNDLMYLPEDQRIKLW